MIHTQGMQALLLRIFITKKQLIYSSTYTFPVYTKGKTGYNINREEEENTVQ